jgi:hypothetical protein
MTQYIDNGQGRHRLGLATCAALLVMGAPLGAMAQQPGQKAFGAAEQAANALVTAAEHNDERALLDLLGQDAKRIIYSGDETEDANGRADFVRAYREMHRLVTEPDGLTTLYVGANNWPIPIPLAHKGHDWYFDSAAGEREILYRRVGRNELSAIHICQALVAAEKEYRHDRPDTYAPKILSDPGQRNGLYWKVAAGEPQSPIGPLVASAEAEGYAAPAAHARTPYRGYHFHILAQQGSHAAGGAHSYIEDGKMTEGFAFVAYPAQYRSSGVMTFIVGADGVVYQKDLGPQTAHLTAALKRYDPDASWHVAEETQTARTGK